MIDAASLQVWIIKLKFWLSYWINELIGTNYVLNHHEDFGQYEPYAIPSHIKTCYTYPVSLVNQNEIPIQLVCQRADEHDVLDQYNPYAMPSEIISC